MKRILFSFPLILLTTILSFGQNVQIDYSEKIDTDTPTLLSLKLDNKTYLKINIQTDLSSKKTASFNFYRAKNGIVSKFGSELPSQLSCITLDNKDKICIEIMMKQSQDSVALAFAVDGRAIDLMVPRNYSIPFPEGLNICYIPMETYLDYPVTVNDEIPIFAITGGICSTMNFMGHPMSTQDYCGLRDKHLHPKEWINIDGVYDYCFYTIKFH